MSPRQKAELLVGRYSNQPTTIVDKDDFTVTRYYGDLSQKSAKHCAIIAADAVIQTLLSIPIRNAGYEQTYDYWNEVKQEIEKL